MAHADGTMRVGARKYDRPRSGRGFRPCIPHVLALALALDLDIIHMINCYILVIGARSHFGSRHLVSIGCAY